MQSLEPMFLAAARLIRNVSGGPPRLRRATRGRTKLRAARAFTSHPNHGSVNCRRRHPAIAAPHRRRYEQRFGALARNICDADHIERGVCAPRAASRERNPMRKASRIRWRPGPGARPVARRRSRGARAMLAPPTEIEARCPPPGAGAPSPRFAHWANPPARAAASIAGSVTSARIQGPTLAQQA
jgi:hypothetical protein